jgi:murein L,D-transpeptidase YcbB/YkuD
LFQVVNDRSHGLDPETFGVRDLHPPEPSDLVQFDIAATSALARYAEALARRDVDWKQVLKQAIDTDSVAELPDRLAPVHIEYARLRTALQTAAEVDRRKITRNMDRWRKLPDNLGTDHIRVNIPAFELEVHEGNVIPLRMKVVVGDNQNKTPVFSGAMNSVVFSPYWNIPQSILTKETLPKIQADPDYAIRQNLEVIRVSGERVEVVDPDEIDWDRVGESDIQLRQRPGSGNSLGLVKFMFPNRHNVYLHDTPADNLFDRLTRNFSHGCIRVEKPQELAELILREQPEWTPERIWNAMRAGKETHVALKETIPVHIVYFTAWVDESGGLQLVKDVYGYD